MQVPCYNCIDRKFKCHSTCEKYLEYQKGCEEKRKERVKNAEFQGYCGDTYTKRYHRRHIKSRR